MKQPQPFFRKQTQSWYVQLGKRQVPLGKDEAKAWAEYHKLMAGKRDLSPSEPVAAVVDEFLEWAQNEREPLTYAYYQRYLASFVAAIGARLPVSDLRPLHVTRWVAANYGGCGEPARTPRARHRPTKSKDSRQHNPRRLVGRARNRLPSLPAPLWQVRRALCGSL